MKMKRYFLLIAIIVSIIGGTIFGLFVGRTQGVTPEEQVAYVIEIYFEAWQQLQPEIMYRYISENDRTDVSIEEYVEQFKQFPVRPVKYQISSISVTGTSARARMIIAWPELEGGSPLSREEVFYLVREDRGWRILEEGSLQY